MSKYTIAFNGAVPAGGELTLVSKRINFPFLLKDFLASFALGQNRTLRLRFFLSFDDEAPTSGKPTGTDLLNILGQSAYLVGDDESKPFPMEVLNRKAGSYIKVYALNTDSFQHTVDCLAVIDSLSAAELKVAEKVVPVGS